MSHKNICEEIISYSYFTGNILIITAITTSKPMQNPTNIFLTSMAVADICVLIFAVPIRVSIQAMCRYKEKNNILRKLLNFNAYFTTFIRCVADTKTPYSSLCHFFTKIVPYVWGFFTLC